MLTEVIQLDLAASIMAPAFTNLMNADAATHIMTFNCTYSDS
jgi:hypothetical protein